MDTQEPIASDFSFAFKRRSHSPSPHDCLAPATLHRAPSTNGSQSPPPSLSDATSSHGSPKDWTSLSWNPAYSLPDINLTSPTLNWQWQHKQAPQPPFLPAVDPMTLTLDEAISLASEPHYFNHPTLPMGIPSQATYSFFHALNGLPEPPFQTDVTSQTGLGHPLSSQLIPNSVTSESSVGDNEAILAVIKAAGIHAAAIDPNSRDVLSAVPIRLPTPPPPKPDLTACPPLAKHIQPTLRPSDTASLPSTSSQGSRPDSPSLEADPQITYGASGRPKTSHTTIERRYRTNLNARILALRRAVPALRILEKDENQNPIFPDDVVDERGFVDGVRAARKASKASILGKAAEYIHVLKKREIRLRHEASGLRLLVGSLVGGQALLREFDCTWKDRYGGEEMDESIDLSDGEEDDCSDDDDDKPRKKPKISNAKSVPQKRDKKPAEPISETGKRKRGRPKKVQATDDSSATFPPTQHISVPPSPQQQGESQNSFGAQYLLGAFLFFSFFQSPTDSQLHYPHETHTGSVIGSSAPKVTQSLGRATMTELPRLRSLASLVAFFVLIKWIMPALRGVLSRKQPELVTRESQIGKSLMHSSIQNSSEAASTLRGALGVSGVISELVTTLAQVTRTSPPHVIGELEIGAWLRLVNVELANGILLGTGSDLGLLLALSRNLPRSPHAMIALAMTAQRFSSILAHRYWEVARSMILDGSRYPEASMEAVALKMPVRDAHSLLVKGVQQGLFDVHAETSPLQTIVAILVLEAFHCLAKAELFRVIDRMSLHTGDERADQYGDAEIEEAMTFVSNTGSIVGGPCGQLLRLWKGGFRSQPDHLRGFMDGLSGSAADTRDLIKVVVLLRGIQETGLLTPTSSTSSLRETATSSPPRELCLGRPRSLSNRLLLRQLLAAPVFESEDTLDDARDLIIDMLYEERR